LKSTSCYPLVVALFASSAAVAAERFALPASDRVRVNIDLDWKFHRGDLPGEEEAHYVTDAVWEPVDIPHDWAIAGPYDRSHNTTQGFLPMGIGWYKKSVYLPSSYEGRRVFLQFDGVHRNSDVWINNRHLGRHESGSTSFIYDITDCTRIGSRVPNGLVVRVDARRHEQDAYEGAGILRHVWLLVTNPLHVAPWGTTIRTPRVSAEQATVTVQTRVRNDHGEAKRCQLATTISDSDGRILATVGAAATVDANQTHPFHQEAKIRDPRLWSPTSPSLYKASTVLSVDGRVVDTYETTFGVRTIRFDANEGFFLNGKHVKLRGFCAHQHFAGLGAALPDRIHWNTLIALKHAGFNLYRASHCPPAPTRLDLCDRLGMMVWDEVERKLDSVEVELDLVRQTIKRDRNHPSVILWSLENESPLEGTTYGTDIIRAGTELAHHLDPTRPTTFASSMSVTTNGYGDAVDVVGYNYHIDRADQDHVARPDWKIGLISEYSAARARRGVYGIEGSRHPNFNLYDGQLDTMYDFTHRIESAWRAIKSRRHVGGGCVWTGMDAWGEGGSWPHVSRGDGALDLCLTPKDAYYYFVSQWTNEPMVHIFPHWTWPGKEGQAIDIWCYTNCDRVELFLNDVSLGIRNRPAEPAPWTPEETNRLETAGPISAADHLAWRVRYQPGTLRAVGRRGGEAVCTQEVHTAGPATRIRLSHTMAPFVTGSQMPPLVADGRDVVVLKAQVLDAADRLVPSADQPIRFVVEGDQRIIGVGNGNTVSHEDNKATSRRAYNGVATVIVQSTTKPGNFTVVAESSGLRSGRITIASTAPTSVGLHVIAERPTIRNNGTQQTMITARAVDRYGVMVPSASNRVTFELYGPGSFGNGHVAHAIDADRGKATVALRSTGRAGAVCVTARSSGLRPDRVRIVAKESDVKPATSSKQHLAQDGFAKHHRRWPLGENP